MEEPNPAVRLGHGLPGFRAYPKEKYRYDETGGDAVKKYGLACLSEY